MAPSLLRPEPLRTASGLGDGFSRAATTVSEHTAPAMPEQDTGGLRVARLQRIGLPRGLADALAPMIFGEGRS